MERRSEELEEDGREKEVDEVMRRRPRAGTMTQHSYAGPFIYTLNDWSILLTIIKYIFPHAQSETTAQMKTRSKKGKIAGSRRYKGT